MYKIIPSPRNNEEHIWNGQSSYRQSQPNWPRGTPAVSATLQFLIKSCACISIFFLATLCCLQDLSSPTRDWTRARAGKAPSPHPWTTRELPISIHFPEQAGMIGCKQTMTWFFSSTSGYIRCLESPFPPPLQDLGQVQEHDQTLWSLSDNQTSFFHFVITTVLFLQLKPTQCHNQSPIQSSITLSPHHKPKPVVGEGGLSRVFFVPCSPLPSP